MERFEEPRGGGAAHRLVELFSALSSVPASEALGAFCICSASGRAGSFEAPQPIASGLHEEHREREREHASARNEVATNEGYDVQRDAEAAYSGVTALRGEGGCISKGKGSACTLMCSGDTLPVRRLTVQ